MNFYSIRAATREGPAYMSDFLQIYGAAPVLYLAIASLSKLSHVDLMYRLVSSPALSLLQLYRLLGHSPAIVQ